MKRFVDLRGQGTGSLFAWYDTGRDEFETFDNCQGWSCWEEFKRCYQVSNYIWTARDILKTQKELQLYRDLLPDWVPKEEPSEDEFDRIDKSRKG